MAEKLEFNTGNMIPVRETGKVPYRLLTVPKPQLARPSLKMRLKLLAGRLTKAQTAVVAFVVGAAFGLVVLGWWIWPVEWTDAGYQHLSRERQTAVIMAASDLYAFDNGSQYAQLLATGWDAGEIACELANESSDLASAARLAYLAHGMGVDCD